MRRVLGLVAAMAAAVIAPAAWADDLALIIAQERHSNLSRLRGVSNEAKALRSAYSADGFDVISVTNADGGQIRDALRKFEDEAAGKDRLVIHYLGHLSVSNQDVRLVPQDGGKASLVESHYQGPSLGLIYELLGKRPGRSAVVLDTPYEQRQLALAWGPHIAQGVLVIAGPVRKTSEIVREALLEDNDTPIAIRANNSALVVTGFVNDEPFDTVFAPNPTVVAAPRDDAFAEMAAWRAATQDGSQAALEGYMAAYPGGLFAGEAQARLDALQPPEARIEAALNLTRNERRDIQRNLTLLGFDTRGVDGIFGRGSRQAVANWQTSERFRATGYLDIAQIRLLSTAAEARKAEMDREAEADKTARDAADLSYWQRTGASGREDDLRAYLREYPDGLFASQATRALGVIEDRNAGAGNNAAEAVEAKLGLNSRTRLMIEQRLAGLKISPGRVDGNFDASTRTAIATFQTRVGLKPTGYLTNETVGQLIASVFR